MHNPEVSRRLVTANERPKVGQLTNERAALVSGRHRAEKMRLEMRPWVGAWPGLAGAASSQLIQGCEHWGTREDFKMH